MKNNDKMNKILAMTIKKYIISYITAVGVFWLLYLTISWGLYGLANLSESRALMNWLGKDYFNDFEPARNSPLYGELIPVKPSLVVEPLDNSQDSEAEDITNGVKYLNENDVWVRDEMDSIQCLQGLFDELNHYDLDKLLKRDSCIKSSRYMHIIIDALKISHVALKDKEYLKKNGDNEITPRFYIRYITMWKDRMDRMKEDRMKRMID